MSQPFVGYLVQDATPYAWITETKSSYRGVGRGTPWPLGDPDVCDRDPAAARWTRVVEEFTHRTIGTRLAPHLLTSFDIATQYADHCGTLGIATRVLYCETFGAEVPAGPMPHGAAVIGFDYAAASCSFSLLADDLNGPEIPGLRADRKKLNLAGLFATAAALGEYVQRRNALISSGTQLESDESAYRFRVAELVSKK